MEPKVVKRHPFSICALERTFISQLTWDKREMLLFGMGPNVYPVEMKQQRSLEFDTEIVVFSTTAVYVKGVVDTLKEGFLLAYGESYIALILSDFLKWGGIVCDRHVISSGRTIVFIRKVHKNKVKIYYEDGSADFVEMGIRDGKICLKKLGGFKFCLEPEEKVTYAATSGGTCWLGTSQGNILSVHPSELIEINSLNIRQKIRQLVVNKAVVADNSFCLLLYQYGNIALYHLGKKSMTKQLQGRYTVLLDQFNVIPSSSGGVTVLAGDRDGNLTNLEIDPVKGDLWVDRVIKGQTANRITVIKHLGYRDTAEICYGTAMGALHFYDLGSDPSRLALSSEVTFAAYSDLSSATILTKSEPHRLQKYFVSYGHTLEREPFKNNPKKFLQTRFFSNQHREILCRFGDQECYIWLNDYSKKRVFPINVDISGKKTKFTIVQAIVMEEYVLIQFAEGTAEVHMYDLEKRTTSPILSMKTSKRVTSALVVVDGVNQDTNRILMVAYLDGRIESTLILLAYRNHTNHFDEAKLNLRGSYIVSMAKTPYNLGASCLMLAANGLSFLIAPTSDKALAIGIALCAHREENLSRFVGNGLFLIETSKGTIVVGRKRNNVSISIYTVDVNFDVMTPLTAVNQLISLPFSGLRKRFSVAQQIEIDTNTWKPTNDLVIAFPAYENDVAGVGQAMFPIVKSNKDTCLPHANTITASAIMEYPVLESPGVASRRRALLTGDRDGILCLWLIDPRPTLNKTNFIVSYKLNGAISQITVSVYNVVAVTTEGDVTLFAKAMDSPEIITRIPYKLKLPIDRISNFPDLQSHVNNSCPEFLVWLADGNVRWLQSEMVQLYSYATEFKQNKKFAHFPIGFKTVDFIRTSNREQNYFLSVGKDNVFRRVHTQRGIVDTKKMKWKVSAFRSSVIAEAFVTNVGCPDGQSFFTLFHPAARQYLFFYVDHLHKHEIIDVTSVVSITEYTRIIVPLYEYFITLDISGMVVIRKFPVRRGIVYRDPSPRFWQSPVPSPQKVHCLIDEGVVTVFGKGYASTFLN